MAKPRILCLHGAASNEDITSFQTGGIRLCERMDCINLNAPHKTSWSHPGLDLVTERPFYAWADRSKSLEDQEDQWDESLEHLAKYVKENGPFDGVYGFSQGAAMITNFSHPKIWKERFKMSSCPWKFAILGCGASSYRITLPKGTTINIPSLHLFGKKDKQISDSKIIAEYWNHTQKETYTHGRGHEIDSQIFRREEEMMEKLGKFLDDNLQDKGVLEAVSAAFSSMKMPEIHLLGHTFGGQSSD